MYICDIDSAQDHEYAAKILLEIARLMQLQDDYIDCWGDPMLTGKYGTDIQQGKCSWLIVTALQKANERQLETLNDNFGKNEPKCIDRVKNIYEELKLKDIYHKEEINQYNKICYLIDGLNNKSILSPFIFKNLLNKIFIKTN